MLVTEDAHIHPQGARTLTEHEAPNGDGTKTEHDTRRALQEVLLSTVRASARKLTPHRVAG